VRAGRILAGCVLLCAVLAACGTAGTGERRHVVVALQEAPQVLNTHVVDGYTPTTFWVTAPVLSGAFRVTPELAYEPVLVTSAEATEDPPTVTYRLREEAVWDDGTPVSAEDLAFTWRVLTDPDHDIAMRAGYEQIEDAEILDAKTVRFTFHTPYAAWRELFAQVLPAHVLEGEDFDDVWDDALTAASGPFRFSSWERGGDLVLVRNERWWGEPATLDRVVIRFDDSIDASAARLAGGEAHVVHLVPTEDVAERLRRLEGVRVETGLGTHWDHLAFRLDHDLLGRPEIRGAIAHAIDREVVVQELITPIHPDAVPLDSAFTLPDQPGYAPAWASTLSHDPAAARRLLAEAGCVEGDDGVAVCGEQRLSLRYATLAGDLRREQLFEVLQAQLAATGIEVVADLAEPSVLFERVPAGDFDLAEFAWVGGPDPEGGVDIWHCDGALNFTGLCDDELDALLAATRTTIDPDERLAVVHAADTRLAELLPAVPLFQTPSLLAADAALDGPRDNPTLAGPLWNLEEWQWSDPPRQTTPR
jgi:peptide/nickel transport system substrate-binding protein